MGVAGVDGCRGGWVVARWEPPSGPVSVQVVRSFADCLAATASARTVVVDIPMGFLDAAETGGRLCDRLARQVLRGRRAASVFSPPVRAVLSSTSYAQALQRNRRSSPLRLGISKQCFHLVPKMAEVDAHLTRARQQRIREAHPELSFQEMNGGEPLGAGKHHAAGREQRVTLLGLAGFGEVQAMLNAPRDAGAGVDDVLDAIALCWTAARVAAGKALRLPPRAPRDARGLAMQIWI